MIIKKLFEAPTFPYHDVVETTDGQYMMFPISPVKHITEADLTPVPGYRAKGTSAIELPAYLWLLYGFERAAQN